MKVCFFTRYDRNGASSRLRAFQYFSFLEVSGVSCTYQPLFTNDYLNSRYNSELDIIKKIILLFKVINRYIIRYLFLLFKVRNYDVIWIEKELFPYLPSFFDHVFLDKGIDYVIDFDDAVFLNYSNYNSSFHKFIQIDTYSKFSGYLKGARHVTVGNKFLADFVLAYNSNVSIIYTSVSFDKYQYAFNNRISKDSEVVIGWIGSPSTEGYLIPLKELINNIISKYCFVKFRICGSKISLSDSCQFENIEWTEDSEFDVVSSFDIGIMPLDDGLWERGKCGYKIVQYMACSIPIVASPVGINTELLSCGCGYLAFSINDWEKYLITLINSFELRRTMGRRGYEFGLTQFDSIISAKKLVTIISGK